VLRYPTYRPIYLAAAEALFLDPANSKVDTDAFAHQIVKLTRSATGMGAYAQIYMDAYQAVYGSQLFKATGVNWRDLKQGIDDVMAHPPFST
jgi:hypothetical protein